MQHTRSRGPLANVDMSTINDHDFRETASLAFYTEVALGDLTHSEDMQSLVDYELTATNTQLRVT